MKVLFICKKREEYGVPTDTLSSGLKNSAQMCANMLNENGIAAALAEVVDNNDIDREVTNYRPTHCIIEALWVVPDKFAVLTQLHPDVTWIVRVHSELTFLATEGIAIQWMLGYLAYPKVLLAGNSHELVTQIRSLVSMAFPKLEDWEVASKVLPLYNYYPIGNPQIQTFRNGKFLDIGCFGAVRPLKNQLIQAAAAMRYAERIGKVLRFHINGRTEQGGAQTMENLVALFNHQRHSLVLHDWMSHDNFLQLMAQMDASMCVSLSETFCIVAADSVRVGVPLICSADIPWACEGSTADTTSLEAISAGLGRILDWDLGHKYHVNNVRNLQDYGSRVSGTWLEIFSV